MAEIFIILNRFNITGRGTVYLLKNCAHANIRIGDILYDLHDHRFKVKGIEMLHRPVSDISLEYRPAGLLFERIDGVEAKGNILRSRPENINFLFCNHPLYPQKADEDYKEEYQAAGLNHPCALFSYENLQMGKLSLYGDELSGLTIYRGWMMKPDMYRDFYSRLEEKGIILINAPEEYERYHMLPGWYEDFKEYTPESVWEDQGSLKNALTMTRGFEGSYIVKDYVKSRKHEWYDACFIDNIADKEKAGKIIGNFISRQGDDLAGGVVLRRFEKLRQTGFHEKSGMPLSEEYRIFAYAGKILIMDDYWNENKHVNLSAGERDRIESIIQKIKSNFVTIDLARREDGSLLIMELGDGQVSGLQQIKAEDFYKAFDAKEDSISIEDFFPEDAVVLTGDPLPDKAIDEMHRDMADINTIQGIVDVYVNIHNKFWFIEDDIFDFEKGTDEYHEACAVAEAWCDLMDDLDSKVMNIAKEEGLLAERQPDSGKVKQLEAFMAKYGYRYGSGWWIKIE